jgi:hypothetical protein
MRVFRGKGAQMLWPYFWIKLGNKQLGIIPDNGMPPLFSERYGHEKVWRGFGYKVIWQDATKYCLRFRLSLTKRYRYI